MFVLKGILGLPKNALGREENGGGGGERMARGGGGKWRGVGENLTRRPPVSDPPRLGIKAPPPWPSLLTIPLEIPRLSPQVNPQEQLSEGLQEWLARGHPHKVGFSVRCAPPVS